MKALGSWLGDRFSRRLDPRIDLGLDQGPGSRTDAAAQSEDAVGEASQPSKAATPASRVKTHLPTPAASTGAPTRAAPERAPMASPFLEARNAHATLAGANVAAARMWQMVAAIALLLAIASVGANVWQASRSTMVPYVIEVDKLGASAVVGPATYSGDTNPTVMQSFLAAWVANARTVTPDSALQRQAVYNVYALLGPNDPGARRINAFYSRDGDSDPFTRAARESVEVQIETALPLTKDSWQVDWVETVRERQSARRTVTTRMRATLQVYQTPLNRRTTEEQMRRNPLGIFIRDFTWAKQLDPLPSR